MIFILGGRGFVGSAFTRYCVRHRLAHRVIDRENYQELAGAACDVLINANGNSKKFLARDKPLEEFDASVRTVRSSLIHFRTGYYVHLSSCDVYPDCSSPQATREDAEPDITGQSPYGFHKYLAEQCVRHAAPRWLILRLGGFVGPGMKKNPIYDILHGGPLWLDPASQLQFLDTDAAAGLVFQLIDRGLDHQVVNVCGKGLIALSEVIDAVGGTVQGKPASPCVRYDVAVDKLSRWVFVPPTRDSVLAFVRARQDGEKSRAA
jgi:nucleoside-diphosphate-sugar epimerase